MITVFTVGAVSVPAARLDDAEHRLLQLFRRPAVQGEVTSRRASPDMRNLDVVVRGRQHRKSGFFDPMRLLGDLQTIADASRVDVFVEDMRGTSSTATPGQARLRMAPVGHGRRAKAYLADVDGRWWDLWGLGTAIEDTRANQTRGRVTVSEPRGSFRRS